MAHKETALDTLKLPLEEGGWNQAGLFCSYHTSKHLSSDPGETGLTVGGGCW